MRGLILTGEDIEKFHDFYHTLGVPTYLEMLFEVASISEEKLQEPGTIRCDPNTDYKLLFVKQKDLPLRGYVPEDIAWDEVQKVAKEQGEEQKEKEQGEVVEKGNGKERKCVNDRLDRYMVLFMRLLPMLLHLVQLSHRPGSKIKHFSTRDWHAILFLEWEEKGLWVHGPCMVGKEEGKGKENQPQLLPIEETIFGIEEAEHLLAHVEDHPSFGKLLYGHEAILELIKGDNKLYNLMHSLSQLLLLQTLPELVRNSKIEESTIPVAINEKGMKHHMLDVKDPSFKTCKVPKLVYHRLPIARHIKNIMIGGNLIGPKGWPTPWSSEDLNNEPKQCRIWLKEMCEFFVDAMFVSKLDQMIEGTDGWFTKYQLCELALGNLREAEMEKLENYLFLRYMLTSIKRGQAPVEFQQSPNGNGHHC
ncbi:unnamed protein product [Peniophora sp. CBMAI 1063]|nr:unnamed protein product [Peniophora sp. CBMAI 1063]